VKLYPSGRIYAVFVVDEAEAGRGQPATREPEEVVGVDVGIMRLATLSDGRFLVNPRSLERSLERVRLLQKSLSRKGFLSKNWLETKSRLAVEYEHVKDFRRDLFFKFGALLALDYDLLVLGDLDVRGLVHKGGTRRRLRLHGSAFLGLGRILEWGFAKRGKVVVVVPEFNSSRECFRCGEIS